MSDLAATFDRLADDAMARCTTCGLCAEACPSAKENQLNSDPRRMVEGLLALTRDSATTGIGVNWAMGCIGSGQCSSVCPEDINVRQWVSIAKKRHQLATTSSLDRKHDGARSFRGMSQAVRLLASMQMPSAELSRIMAPVEGRTADVIFYTGCNVLKTAHIVFNVMDIFDVLGVNFDVVGGPSHCCGVFQFEAGDLETYDRVGARTFRRFEESGASRVLTWCPTCTRNFTEIEVDRGPPAFGLDTVSVFLTDHLDELKARFLNMPPQRAVLHEHSEIGGNLNAMRELLRSVPNLTLLDLPQDSGFSYVCGRGTASRYPQREAAIHKAIAESTVEAGADLLITMYHSCHRALAGAEDRYPFRVVNFTDILAEALGRGGHTDYYKLYRTGGGMQQAVADARKYLESNGVKVDIDTVAALTSTIFDENGISQARDEFKSSFSELAK